MALDHDAVRKSVHARTAEIRRKTRRSASTEAELRVRQLDTVDLIVGGATVRHVSEHFGRDVEDVRKDYAAGLALLVDKSVDRAVQLREEVTARQRALILANMPKAKAGNLQSAHIVAAADNLLASIWGLRSLRIDPPVREGDARLADAVEGYLAGLAEGVKAKPS